MAEEPVEEEAPAEDDEPKLPAMKKVRNVQTSKCIWIFPAYSFSSQETILFLTMAMLRFLMHVTMKSFPNFQVALPARGAVIAKAGAC